MKFRRVFRRFLAIRITARALAARICSNARGVLQIVIDQQLASTRTGTDFDAGVLDNWS
jgi:hypothetical protein